jgi:hypothetical protein
MPMGKSLILATAMFGVKSTGKWWEKDMAGGGSLNVPALAEGLEQVLGSFANFDRLVGFAPTELDGAVITLDAYADRFMAIATSLDRMRYALYQTVKFAKLKVTPDKIVAEASAKIDQLSEAFATLDELVVDSTMAKVAEALVGDNKVQVDHKGLSIRMRINVIIDSKDLALSLQTEEGDPYFVVNESKDNPFTLAEHT